MVVFVLLAGCATAVSGAPTGSTVASTSSRAATLAEPTAEPEPDVPTPPTAIDPAADQQYCDQPITGALGKQMQVVVVATPAGRIDCDGAGAVLVDYYAERPAPDPGSDPIVVAGFACNQVPHPDIPQVICTDGASLLYSMWRQGG